MGKYVTQKDLVKAVGMVRRLDIKERKLFEEIRTGDHWKKLLALWETRTQEAKLLQFEIDQKQSNVESSHLRESTGHLKRHT